MTIIIRVVTSNDAAPIQAIYAPIVESSAISFEDSAPTVQEMQQRIEATLKMYPYLVAECDDHVIAYAFAGQHRARAAYRWSVDTTVYVDEAARRSGIGRMLYQELLAILEAQGFHAAFAGIAMPNAASIGLHESAGFEFVGLYKEVGFKHGRWHDVGWWRRTLACQQPPIDPIPFPDLVHRQALVV